MRLGGHGEWQLALRSDGSAVVTRLEENEAGGSAGVGVSFSPAGLDASASVTLTAGYRSGRAWRFDSAAEARAFLDGARRDADVSAAREPDERWDALAGTAGAEAGAALAGLAELGVEASGDAVLGLRRDGATRTVTVDIGSEAPAASLELPGFPATPAARRAVVAEVTVGGRRRPRARAADGEPFRRPARGGHRAARSARPGLPRARRAAPAPGRRGGRPARARRADRDARQRRARRLRGDRGPAWVQRRRPARRGARARARARDGGAAADRRRGLGARRCAAAALRLPRRLIARRRTHPTGRASGGRNAIRGQGSERRREGTQVPCPRGPVCPPRPLGLAYRRLACAAFCSFPRCSP